MKLSKVEVPVYIYIYIFFTWSWIIGIYRNMNFLIFAITMVRKAI